MTLCLPDHIIIADSKIPLQIKKSVRAKRISIRISPSGNGVMMTLPKRASLENGLRFIQSKSAWVQAHLRPVPVVSLADGTVINVFGKPYTIHHQEGRGVTHFAQDTLVVYGDTVFTARRVATFLKACLHAECTLRAQEMADRIGKKIQAIRISTATTRWGSCTAKGVVSFNYLLVFAPVAIMDYVIAHEVAHLQEMNHSVKFWHVVEGLYPNYKMARKWLKTNAQALHAYV